jgi:hypothetical protein
VFRFRTLRPRSKVSNRVNVPLAKGMFRGARSAADRDKCDVADLLLMQGHTSLMAARARAEKSPGAAARFMGGMVELADAASEVAACRARARERITTATGENP